MEVLKIGSIGPFVELLQTALNRAGYYLELMDGFFWRPDTEGRRGFSNR